MLPLGAPVYAIVEKFALVGTEAVGNVSSPTQQVEAPAHNVVVSGAWVFAGAYVTTNESAYDIEDVPAPISAAKANFTQRFDLEKRMRKTPLSL
jgi:hypothetical protein